MNKFSLNENPLWETNDSSIWMATSFLFMRNLASHPFPSKMSEKESQQILSVLKKGFLQSSALKEPSFIEAKQLEQTEKEYLFEHFLFEDDQNESQGYVIDQTAAFFAVINAQNHLLLQYNDCRSDWKEGWEKLSELELELSKMQTFAYNPTFGYLTADPSQAGTGFIVRSYLHLPCLIHLDQINEVLEKELDEDVEAHGMGGADECTGDILILQNKYTIGLTENHILQSVHKTATKLQAHEKTLRDHLKEDRNSFIINKISRSFGLLNHSYQIETKEALGALSLIKLGIDLKWICGIDDKKINELFFECRRGHLARVQSEDELAKKRATFLKGELKNMTMNIQ